MCENLFGLVGGRRGSADDRLETKERFNQGLYKVQSANPPGTCSNTLSDPEETFLKVERQYQSRRKAEFSAEYASRATPIL